MPDETAITHGSGAQANKEKAMKYLLAVIAAFTVVSCTVKEQEAEPTTTVAPATTVVPTTQPPTTRYVPPITEADYSEDICDIVWDQGTTREPASQGEWCRGVIDAMETFYGYPEAQQVGTCAAFWEMTDDEIIWQAVGEYGMSQDYAIATVDFLWTVCE